MYRSRSLEAYLSSVAAQFPVMMVTGARQVGKTTLLQSLSDQDRKYVTLDDPMALALAREDPALFFQRFSGPVLIDEIQYAPGLLPYIKMAVDRNQTPGQFWLTGSQQFHLMKSVSESLAGRVGIVRLLGFSRREMEEGELGLPPFLPTQDTLGLYSHETTPLSLGELYRLIWRGSFPALACNEKLDRDLYYSSYVQTYLQRDIRDLARVGDEMAFLRFVKATAARSAQLLNLAALARDADIAPNTAKSWLSILEASGLVYLLQPYHNNVTKRLVKASKLYFLDTGLCAWLTGWTSPETLESGAASGPILETWILGELLKSWWHQGRQAPFYYYRDRDKKEIDLLILQDGTIYPLEFKRTASPSKDAVRNISLLDKLKIPVGPGGLVCLCQQSMPLGARAVSIPLGWI
ncbi:MAG: ATP-binding protein [Candidatus Krumholzibacteria bacterium]|jgi:hypothetical protein|nr:ATP-binding protein [Candidatus Krumholzibacteria bacterium]MDP6669686.1 ATP-binding protein [Candidatus Krumholzibacteria bacterium]MDP7022415.1 ATP-binding protein [Candidatus Krumholzibacteria bacterium]